MNRPISGLLVLLVAFGAGAFRPPAARAQTAIPLTSAPAGDNAAARANVSLFNVPVTATPATSAPMAGTPPAVQAMPAASPTALAATPAAGPAGNSACDAVHSCAANAAATIDNGTNALAVVDAHIATMCRAQMDACNDALMKATEQMATMVNPGIEKQILLKSKDPAYRAALDERIMSGIVDLEVQKARGAGDASREAVAPAGIAPDESSQPDASSTLPPADTASP